jgi:hypothetical protein
LNFLGCPVYMPCSVIRDPTLVALGGQDWVVEQLINPLRTKVIFLQKMLKSAISSSRSLYGKKKFY